MRSTLNRFRSAAVFVFGMLAWGLPHGVAHGAAPKKAASAATPTEKAAGKPPAEPEAPEPPSAPLDPISFAGIWMAGPAEDWARRFPVGKDLVMTRRVLSEEAAKSFELSKQLLDDLRTFQNQNPGGNRIVDALAGNDYQPRADSGSALVMACVLNHEYCFSRKVGRSLSQKFAEVSFDLVICDFATLSVVATFPYRIEMIGSASDKDADMLRRIYTGGIADAKQAFTRQTPVFQNEYINNDPTKPLKVACPATLREAFLNLAKTPVKALSFEKAAVRKVNVRDDALNAMDPYFKPIAEEYFAGLFANNFFFGTTHRPKNPAEKDRMKIRWEYAANGVACLPFSKGNEVVYSMLVEELADAFRVKLRARSEADSKNVNFSLGRPLYDVDLVMPGFQTNAIPAGLQFSAYSRIEIKVDDQTFYSRKHDGSEIHFAGVERTWANYAAATNTMFTFAGLEILKAVTGPEINKNQPLDVSKPAALRKFFLMCAPDCAKSFTQVK